LQRRGGVLHFRIAVPHHLRKICGTAEITQSLRTCELAVAAPLALDLAARVKQAYLSPRASLEVMDSKQFRALWNETVDAARHADELARLEVELAEVRRKHEAELHLAKLKASHDAIMALSSAHAPAHSAQGSDSASTALPAAAPNLAEVVAAFLKIATRSGGTAMSKKHQTVLPLLVTSIGDKPVNQIKQADLNQFFDLISKLPPRWSDICRKRRITPLQLAALGEGELAPKTFEDTYKASVRLFLKAARRDWQDQGFPAHLSVEGIAYSGAVGEGKNKQRAFRPDELRTLFTALREGGYKAHHDSAHQYWLPRIGLFTGARVNEICQLNPEADILQEQGSGIWHFCFTEDSEGDERVKKSIKNNRSVRRVPLHPDLIADGFLGYVKEQRNRGAKLLFPAWKPTRGRASPAAEKWFIDLLRELDLRDETPGARLVGMHAFRHLILHRAFNARPPVDVTPITGHADDAGSIVAGYRGEMLLENKLEILKRVDFSF
jgi:integrase